ncbi:MAG TPA: LuxR C-terminal-related transcriptional regulator [Ktedonosporobacter sp.]|nr:LuxR C-terminal-related transcriptional regulator [Ktedonosporobacter sp.]
MPKPPLHALIWSHEHQRYELHSHGQPVSCFRRGDEPAFSRWLAQHSAFAFVGKSGRLSVLKEARSRGASYWYAYSTRARPTRKRYLGCSDNVTLARLEQEAKELAGSSEPASLASRPTLQETMAPSSPREEAQPEESGPPDMPQQEPWAAFLSTKLSAPRLPHTLLERSRLLTDLQAFRSHPLTLVSASAGSGKTTLLSAWVAASKLVSTNEVMGDGAIPVFAWLSLDALDNDPIPFWSSVIAALRTCLPSIGQTALTLLHAQQALPLSGMLTTLLQEIGQASRELVLILDDYHVISDPALQQSMLFLLEHLPACLHLVLATRTDPAFPLARWRARGQLLEIRDHELRFSRAETTSFLLQCMRLPLTDEDVVILQRRTQGWIAGLHLAALALRTCEDRSAFVKDFAGTHRFVLDYVQQDLLAQLPGTLQDFLLQTAILTSMNAAVCQAVTALPTPQASQQMLEALDQANLFVVPLDSGRQWYRYHDLFREALCARLQASQPERLPLLHSRAARWYEAVGELREAITHALAAPDFPYAASLIEQAALPFWLRGEAHLVHDWVQALPDAVLWQHVSLALDASLRLLISVHESTQEVYARTQAQLQRALARIEGGLHGPQNLMLSDAEHALVQRRLRLLRALLEGRSILRRGNTARLRQLAQETEDLPQDEEVIWKMIPLSFTFWLTKTFLDGEVPLLPRLREMKQQALHAGDDLAMMRVRLWLAMAYVLDGQLHQAHQECQEAVAWIEQTHGRMAMAGYIYMSLFDVYYAWNRLEEAENALSRLMHIGQEWHQADLLAVAEADSVWLALARGDLSAAQEALHRYEALVEREGLSHQAAWVSRLRVQCWLAQGKLAQASQWAAHTTFSRQTWHQLYARDVLMQVRVTLAQQHYTQAAQMLHQWSQCFERPEQGSLTMEFLILQLIALHHAGQREQALAVAARLFSITEPEGFVRLYVDAGEPMKQVLQALLQTPQEERLDAAAETISRSYVSHLLALFEREEGRNLHAVEAESGPSPASRSPFPQKDGSSMLLEPLSVQELKVLQGLCAGQTYAEIAEGLIVSPNTIKTQVSSIYRKLGVSRRAEAIAVTARLHLLS